MTREMLLAKGVAKLSENEIMNAQIDAMYLLEAVLHISKMEYLLDRQTEVSAEEEEAYMSKIALRSTHVPLQHILGTQEFMGYEFLVNEHVLIPRQDTEILVEEAIPYGKGKRILDVCTGSGCILLSLTKLCSPTVAVGVDLSVEALKVARENAKQLACDVTFMESDLFTKVEGTFDLIVSNPPYIESAEILTLMEEVREHEPRMALDGGEDGLIFYRRIVEEAPKYLSEDSYLCFEIGCEQGLAVKELMEQRGFLDCRVVKDLAGLDRVVVGHWSVLS